MQPEMIIRPTLLRAWPASTTRTIRSAFSLLVKGAALVCVGARIGGEFHFKLSIFEKNGSAKLHQHGVADEADGKAFDLKRFAGFNDDGLEIGVFRM